MQDLVQSAVLVKHDRTYKENPNSKHNKYALLLITFTNLLNRFHLVCAEYVIYNKCGFPCKFIYKHQRLTGSWPRRRDTTIYAPHTLLMSLEFDSHLVFDQDTFHQQAVNLVHLRSLFHINLEFIII